MATRISIDRKTGRVISTQPIQSDFHVDKDKFYDWLADYMIAKEGPDFFYKLLFKSDNK